MARKRKVVSSSNSTRSQSRQHKELCERMRESESLQGAEFCLKDAKGHLNSGLITHEQMGLLRQLFHTKFGGE